MIKDNSTGKNKDFYDLGKKMFDRIPPIAQPEPWTPEDMAHRSGGLAQSEQNQFKPDWNTEAVLVEEMQRMAKQIAEMQDWEAIATDQAMTIALLRSEAITQAIPQIPQEHSSNEPVAFLCHGNLFMWLSENDFCGNAEDHIPLYASPPEREWVGLTDEAESVQAFVDRAIVTSLLPQLYSVINRLLDGTDKALVIEARRLLPKVYKNSFPEKNT